MKRKDIEELEKIHASITNQENGEIIDNQESDSNT